MVSITLTVCPQFRENLTKKIGCAEAQPIQWYCHPALVARNGVLEFGTGSHECFTSLVVLKLLEVVDEHLGELVGFNVPL